MRTFEECACECARVFSRERVYSLLGHQDGRVCRVTWCVECVCVFVTVLVEPIVTLLAHATMRTAPTPLRRDSAGRGLHPRGTRRLAKREVRQIGHVFAHAAQVAPHTRWGPRQAYFSPHCFADRGGHSVGQRRTPRARRFAAMRIQEHALLNNARSSGGSLWLLGRTVRPKTGG